ncbi:tannase/feruloyl esterase family alpha/beta hydrolase [uncultured Aquincola sp.]|uniref:tannase/feruloyl esterase family alpha/beta hydrolase n=1 Tax=uncultured Aquincola sp. TaxID=886556 RepID=UPI0032B2F03E
MTNPMQGRRLAAGLGLAATVLLAACGSNDDDRAALACDSSLATAFQPDAQTSVVAVKAFSKGDALLLSGSASANTPTAAADVCMVKLNVGPGNPGPAGAPSTSAGIGIEVWLPAKAAWNNRIHALGGGGWQGGPAGSATAIASTAAAAVAGVEGAVSSTTDTGHAVAGTGAFAMNPDGSINQTLWTDFATRAIHEQAVKTKALAAAYYGRPARWAYWEGGSTGGRQGLNLALNHPEHYDGMVANYPAIHWTRFITSELYPQIVYQRDLGGAPLSKAQVDLVSNAAINACDTVGGTHLGYLIDPAACRYNPVQDSAVLCAADGGSNTTAACVSQLQAQALNKIWYGMTSDGSVPDPATDNGWQQVTASTLMGNGLQRWTGLTRGTNLGLLAGAQTEFTIASDVVALELQDPTLAGTSFLNAKANGQAGWKQLSYAQLNNAYERGLALQSQFANINTDNPDLSAYKNRGGKIITWHGLADELIAPQGTINYYHRVAAAMGGMANAQSFFRLYLVPGQGHGSPNGTSNPAAIIPAVAPGQMYGLLTDWVEKGTAPDQVMLTTTTSAGTTRSMPVCVYPKKISYQGGDVGVGTSYGCS